MVFKMEWWNLFAQFLVKCHQRLLFDFQCLHHIPQICSVGVTHLSKIAGDIKQNRTQYKKSLLSGIFLAPIGGICSFSRSHYQYGKKFSKVNERENGIFSCVPFCLRSLEPVERCVSKLLFRADFWL